MGDFLWGKFMNNKIYLMLIGFGVLICVYIFGIHSGYQKCNVKFATQTNNQQSHVIEIQRKVNAEVFNRGVSDIRNVLRQKYTIAD